MEDIPENIEMAFIDSDEHLEGVGETVAPLTGGAIANAFL